MTSNETLRPFRGTSERTHLVFGGLRLNGNFGMMLAEDVKRTCVHLETEQRHLDWCQDDHVRSLANWNSVAMDGYC